MVIHVSGRSCSPVSVVRPLSCVSPLSATELESSTDSGRSSGIPSVDSTDKVSPDGSPLVSAPALRPVPKLGEKRNNDRDEYMPVSLTIGGQYVKGRVKVLPFTAWDLDKTNDWMKTTSMKPIVITFPTF